MGGWSCANKVGVVNIRDMPTAREKLVIASANKVRIRKMTAIVLTNFQCESETVGL